MPNARSRSSAAVELWWRGLRLLLDVIFHRLRGAHLDLRRAAGVLRCLCFSRQAAGGKACNGSPSLVAVDPSPILPVFHSDWSSSPCRSPPFRALGCYDYAMRNSARNGDEMTKKAKTTRPLIERLRTSNSTAKRASSRSGQKSRKRWTQDTAPKAIHAELSKDGDLAISYRRFCEVGRRNSTSPHQTHPTNRKNLIA